jgi:hypothetical protein
MARYRLESRWPSRKWGPVFVHVAGPFFIAEFRRTLNRCGSRPATSTASTGVWPICCSGWRRTRRILSVSRSEGARRKAFGRRDRRRRLRRDLAGAEKLERRCDPRARHPVGCRHQRMAVFSRGSEEIPLDHPRPPKVPSPPHASLPALPTIPGPARCSCQPPSDTHATAGQATAPEHRPGSVGPANRGSLDPRSFSSAAPTASRLGAA